jgi:replicative DNA helicase
MTEEIRLETVEPSAGRGSIFDLYRSKEAGADLKQSGEGFSTGFAFLDSMSFHLVPGKLYAVAARPGSGKTALLLELLLRHAEIRAGLRDQPDDYAPIDAKNRAPAVFVSYEEPRSELYVRLLLRVVAEQAGGPPAWWTEKTPGRWWARKWLKAELKIDRPEIEEAFSKAAAYLDGLIADGHMALVDGDRDGGNIDLLLASLTRGAAAKGGPSSLVLVDYYQKIRPPESTRASSRQMQLQEVADRLRQFAKGELVDAQRGASWAVPVFVGAQVNRTASAQGKEDGDPPDLDQIREADDLANDAAGVITLHLQGEELKAKVAKNRDGRRSDSAFIPRLGLWTFEGASGRILEPTGHVRSSTSAPAFMRSPKGGGK